ncbi:hypothetical protein [Flavobacterium succinicans]|uniref:Uncharacterized protein n=1 Tax=Flavobacterium succinicans TaxID=29536 RepID=A0A199XQ85_9FLAO|nr:hypothetical protein [Flavobacterium succinicans]OAZ03908.1 hypothetical protein FLB_15970 [Flavobacterium succinicans]
MNTPYRFSKEENTLLEHYSKKKTVTAVFYHLWVNGVQPEKQFIFIDTVELHFEDQSVLFFKINEEDTGFIILEEYDFEKEQAALAAQFDGALSLKRVNVSSAPLWVENIKTPLLKMQSQIDEKYTVGNFVTIDFEAGAIEINYEQETGIGVIVYEEL